MNSYCLQQVLVGRTEAHLAPAGPVKLHRAVLGPLLDLERAARAAGFELTVASGFRSFERQLVIWNGKASGERPLHDDHGRPLDASALHPDALLAALLRFSALPGASRHHWGTDFDVFDARALTAGATLQLTPGECAPGGIMHPFHCWLGRYLAGQQQFFRPYSRDRGGVAPEPWHLSYAPLSRALEGAHSPRLLAQSLTEVPLALAEEILPRLPQLYDRYTRVPLCLYPAR